VFKLFFLIISLKGRKDMSAMRGEGRFKTNFNCVGKEKLVFDSM
jgi:hypothetical protein